VRFAVILYAAVSLNAAALRAQDSTFVKMAYGGSYIAVPQGESWGIERVFITGNDGFSIQVSNDNFAAEYSALDTIQVPHYIAEMEMLSPGDMLQFKFYIKKLNLIKIN
tara:strand:+ start:270 stop:596 length:327 start_codon:yes stop_codon:yes gene_type:complete